MSASSKKKLRKEQSAAKLTEKQQKERFEAKKLKTISIIFVIAMLVIALTAATVLLIRGITNAGIKEKNTIAAVVGDHELNSVELNYFYVDYANSFYTEWSYVYGEITDLYLQMMGLDPTNALDAQVKDQETGETWADYFMEETLEKIKSTYVLYDMAMAENFVLSEDDQLILEYTIEQLDAHTLLYGYRNNNTFLRAVYGPGANTKSYTDYITVSTIANAYYNAKSDSLVYSDADIQAYDEEHPLDFNTYDFAVYYVSYSEYAEGGTENEDGIIIYNDEEKAEALEKAERVATLLSASKNVEELDEAIQSLEVNADTTTTSTKNEGIYYANVPEEYRDWVTDESRVENDITMIPYTVDTTDEDGNETSALNGYYVVAFLGSDDNLRPLANVRHLLVGFEGGTTDEDGVVTYSDAEKAAAKAEAEALLQTWLDGEATEESFIALVKENTDDNASVENGGLYEDIHPDSNYMENFLNWSIDKERQVGDTGIVESDSGYHIMYYSSHDEITNRDRLITNELRSADLEAWFTEICDAATIEALDLSNMVTGIVLSSAY